VRGTLIAEEASVGRCPTKPDPLEGNAMNNPYSQDPAGNQHDDGGQYASYGQPKRKNVLGIIGFIFSVTCLLAPLGLLMSFIALFKSPRGFAIAGVLVGALFSIPHGFIALNAYQWSTMSPGEIVAANTMTETGTIIIAVEKHTNQTGRSPDSLDNLGLSEASRTDFWGTPYRFEPDPTGGADWTLSSAGPDGEFGTSDDLIDLVDFASDKSGQQAFTASFEQSIDLDQFDREAAKEELFESTMEMFQTIMGNRSPAPNQGNSGTPADDSSSDPADPPTDTPDDPADPATP
jgi:hypothetical protein